MSLMYNEPIHEDLIISLDSHTRRIGSIINSVDRRLVAVDDQVLQQECDLKAIRHRIAGPTHMSNRLRIHKGEIWSEKLEARFKPIERDVGRDGEEGFTMSWLQSCECGYLGANDIGARRDDVAEDRRWILIQKRNKHTGFLLR